MNLSVSHKSVCLVVVLFIVSLTTYAVPAEESRSETRMIRPADIFEEGEVLKLVLAIDRMDEKTITAAIKNKDVLNGAGRFGITPMHWAILQMKSEGTRLYQKRVAVARQLVEAGANCNKRCHPEDEIFRHQLNRKLIIGVHKYGYCYPEGASPLHMAVPSQRVPPALIRRMLECGAKVNLVSAGAGKTTALHRAVAHGTPETVEILLNAGADMARPNGFGTLPLDTAIWWQVAIPLVKRNAPFRRTLPESVSMGPHLHREHTNGSIMAHAAAAYRPYRDSSHKWLQGIDARPWKEQAWIWREQAAFWRTVAFLEQRGIDVEELSAKFEAKQKK